MPHIAPLLCLIGAPIALLPSSSTYSTAQAGRTTPYLRNAALPSTVVDRSDQLSAMSVNVDDLGLSSGDLGAFASAFTALSRIGRIGMVAEGSPTRPVLTSAEFTQLRKSLVAQNRVSFGELVTRVARAYHYSAVLMDQAGKRYVLLRKNYDSVDDLPFVTLGEANRAFESIASELRILVPSLPAGGPQCPPIKFVLSLTDDQLRTAGSGSGLPASMLTVEQRQTLRDWMIQQHYGSVPRAAGEIRDFLQQTRAPQSDYRTMNLMATGIDVIGFEGPFGLNRIPLQYGISEHIRAHVLNGPNDFLMRDGRHVVSSWVTGTPQQTNLYDLTRPDIAATSEMHDQIEAGMGTGAPLDWFTRYPADGARSPAVGPSDPTVATILLGTAAHPIGRAVGSSNARNAGTEWACRVAVDSVVADKPVRVFDATGAMSPLRQAQAIADLYGLCVLRKEDGSYVITTHAPLAIKDFGAVQEAMRQTFPDPWIRYYRASIERAQMAAASGLSLHGDIHQSRAAADPGTILSHASDDRYRALARQMEAVVGPQVAAAPTRSVPMSAAGALADRLLVLLSINDALPAIDRLIDGPEQGRAASLPPVPTDMNDSFVYVAADFNLHSMRLVLCRKRPDGRLAVDGNVVLQDPAVSRPAQ